MKEYENSENDILKEWIESAGNDIAPDGFTEKVMNRIELVTAPSKAYSSPFSFSFKVSSIVMLSVLILMTFLLASPVEYSWYTSISDKIGQLRFNLPELHEFGNLMGNFSYLLYISIGIFLVIISDSLISRLFSVKD